MAGMSGITPESFQTLGDLLRFLRTRAGLSQRELAARVNYHYGHVNRFEKNLRRPDRSVLLARFVSALGIENEADWVNRLLELADDPSFVRAKIKVEQAASEENIYQVPNSLNSIVGRDKESSLLVDVLLQSDVRLVTVVGPPGVGKTRLSLHVAEALSGHFLHGAVFVDLTPTTENEMVMQVMAETLGILETSAAPSMRHIQAFLRNKSLLVVMDNFEQVLGAAPQLVEILRSAPSVKFLVTSREALRIDGEWEFLLDPLSVPNKLQMDRLDELMDASAAMQLFVQRAAAVKPGFQLNDSNASLIAEICCRLDGLPLAIELAAARLHSMSLAEMLSQFNRLFDWLTRGRRDTAIWRRTLLGAIEWSYNLLEEKERLLFVRLAVFSGGWTLEAVEQICSDDRLGETGILQPLSRLVDCSLVFVETTEGYTRYRFLGTIFHFADSKLREMAESELAALRDRHLAYFSKRVEALEASLESSPPLQIRLQMDVELNNIRSALSWGLNEYADREVALWLACSTGQVLLRLSHFQEALDWASRYLPIAGKHFKAHSRLLFLATALSYWRDNLEQAVSFGSKGLEISRAIGDKRTCADILYYLGEIYRETGHLELARRSAEESLHVCRTEGFVERSCMALTGLGVILFQLGEHHAALTHVHEALDLAMRKGNLWTQSYTLRVKADFLRLKGRFSEAFRAYEQALSVSSEIDDRISIGMELANMSLLANVMEDYTASAYYAQKALLQFQAIGNEYQQPFPMRMLAYAFINEKDLQRARNHCMDSLRGNQSIGHKTGIVACLICLAEIAFAEGNHQGASRLLATIHEEMMSKDLKLMEPDVKALAKLQEVLLKKTHPATIESSSGLGQILNELGLE